MVNLGDLILEKLEKLSNTEIPNQLEREFFEEFLKNYSVHNVNSYENISNVAYLTCVLASNNIKMDFYELISHIKKIENFINDVDFDINIYYSYIDSLKELNEMGILEKIVNKQKINTSNSAEKCVYKKYQKNCKKLFDLNNNEGYLYQVNMTLNKLFLALPKPDKFKSFISVHIIVDQLKDLLAGVINDGFEAAEQDDMFDDYQRSIFKGREFNRFVEKEKNKILREHVKDIVETCDDDLIEEYNLICKHYQELIKKDKEVVKSTNKKIRNLEELMYKLRYINPDRAIKIDDSIKDLLFDPEIRYYYYLLAVCHNYGLYENEEKKNVEFNNNSLTKLEILFSKYSFNFNDFNEEEQGSIINKTSVFQVESILNSIRYSELSFISDYVSEFAKVIIFSKPEVIKFVDSLLKNKIIDKKFIFKNINILCDAHEFDNLYNNVNYLNSIGINLSNLVKDKPEILLFDNQEVIVKTDILNKYKLKLNKEDIYNFDVLKDDKVLDLLDNYIELGLKDIVLENPRYLVSDGFDTIKRIMICDLIGIDFLNKSNKIIGSVSTGNNFYVSPKDYDNFIINYKQDYQNPICLKVLDENRRNTISSSTKNHNIIKKLDELYMKDELTYVINSVIISRNRVIRNLEILLNYLSDSDIGIKDLIYQAILYKMVNNVELCTLEQIYNSVYSIDLENDKIYTLK